jgi:hypothetical protein
MDLLLILFLLTQMFAEPQGQTDPNIPSDVEVQGFSLHHYPGTSSVEGMNGSANPSRRRRDFRREIDNRNSIENRSRDMREMEESMQREVEETRPVDKYRYRLELKNRGAKVIKWIFFDYQISDASDPDSPSHRQFACAAKIKPDDTRALEAFSNLPPRRTVNAANVNAKPVEKLIITRIEYADGAAWQRSDWHLPDPIPSRSNAHGQCRPL